MTNTGNWYGSPCVTITKEDDGSFKMDIVTKGEWEEYYTPIYLTTGITYELSITYKINNWASNLGGSMGWEIAYAPYFHASADRHVFINFVKTATNWTTAKTSFTVSRAGTYYLGINGGPLPDGYNYSFSVKDCVLSIMSQYEVFDGTNIDVQHTTSMKNMFKGQNNFHRCIGMSGWNTAVLTDTSHMFDGCSKLSLLTSIANWDMSHVTDMSYMFNGVVLDQWPELEHLERDEPLAHVLRLREDPQHELPHPLGRLQRDRLQLHVLRLQRHDECRLARRLARGCPCDRG